MWRLGDQDEEDTKKVKIMKRGGGGWNETRYKYVHSININYVYLLYLDEGYILVYYQ